MFFKVLAKRFVFEVARREAWLRSWLDRPPFRELLLVLRFARGGGAPLGRAANVDTRVVLQSMTAKAYGI